MNPVFSVLGVKKCKCSVNNAFSRNDFLVAPLASQLSRCVVAEIERARLTIIQRHGIPEKRRGARSRKTRRESTGDAPIARLIFFFAILRAFCVFFLPLRQLAPPPRRNALQRAAHSSGPVMKSSRRRDNYREANPAPRRADYRARKRQPGGARPSLDDNSRAPFGNTTHHNDRLQQLARFTRRIRNAVRCGAVRASDRFTDFGPIVLFKWFGQ